MKLTKEQDELFDRYGGEVVPGELIPANQKAAVVRRRKANYERTEVLNLDVLPYEPLPAGAYLVHNRVRPQKPLGKNGFCVWIQHTPLIFALTIGAAHANALTEPQHWELYETAPYKVWGQFPSVELCMGAALREQPRIKAGAVGCKTELPALPASERRP